ncbi:restriction endonuclease subunit S [Mailhella massiliensis]|uniref:restriction endonuclease subunit S n=1 Tax=Mailhella massiliensis TaxID=1903261 RepID=UPI001950D95C
MSFEKGIVKNLHYGDILIKFNEILDSCDKKIPFISREMNFEKIKNAILKNGDVVIADAAEDEAVGKCTEIFNISQNEQIISGLHTIPCRPNIDFAQGFLGYYMNSNSYHSQLVPLMQGIKVLSLSKSSLQDTLITFPRTKKEQARIGTFFRHLDRLITLHQCNCNMATRPYEWSSGLRAIAWEQREFKNLFKILPNNTLSRAELSFEKGIVKNLHYGDILIKFNEILDSCDKKIPFISREMNFEKIKNAILKNGDVVIADAAEDEAVGKCTEIFNISQNEQIISGLHTIPCRPNIDFAQGFLGYYMNSNSYHSQLVPLMQGIKVLSLSKSSLQDTLITFPRTKKEQARIGTFFRHLDRLITLHQRKHILLT